MKPVVLRSDLFLVGLQEADAEEDVMYSIVMVCENMDVFFGRLALSP